MPDATKYSGRKIEKTKPLGVGAWLAIAGLGISFALFSLWLHVKWYQFMEWLAHG